MFLWQSYHAGTRRRVGQLLGDWRFFQFILWVTKRGIFAAGQRFDLVRCLLVRNFLLARFLHGKMASSRGRVCRNDELLLREIYSFGSHIYKKNFNHLCSQKENVWSCWYQGKESHRTLSTAGAILKPHHDDRRPVNVNAHSNRLKY